MNSSFFLLLFSGAHTAFAAICGGARLVFVGEIEKNLIFIKNIFQNACMVQKFTISLHPLNETTAFNLLNGEVAEWSIAPVLKTDVPRGTGGSNPSLSAKRKADRNSNLFEGLSAFSFCKDARASARDGQSQSLSPLK